MFLEHALDLRRARAALEASDGSLSLHEDERRHDLHTELVRDVGAFVDVYRRNAQAFALPPGQMRHQAVHPSRRARFWGVEEDEKRSCLYHGCQRCPYPGGPNANHAMRPTLHLNWLAVGGWYWIGVALGFGVAIGVLLAAILGFWPLGWAVAALVAVGIGVVVGFALPGDWAEAIAGGVGGLAGAAGTGRLVAGALRSGGTRLGTALLVGVAGIGLAALALVPVVGYLEAVAVPGIGARLRKRAPQRYAGLRSLAD